MPRSNPPGAAPLAPGASRPHCTPAPPTPRNRQILPEARREDQLRHWGLNPDWVGALRLHERQGPTAEDAAPTGVDAGPDQRVSDVFVTGGWHAVEPQKGSLRGGGTTAHRGTLHPDEYVDALDLRARVSEHLGFTVDEIRSVYRQGPLSAEGRALRARIDARLLEVASQGGLMAELGRALGWALKPDGHCRPMDTALGRARAAREEAS